MAGCHACLLIVAGSGRDLYIGSGPKTDRRAVRLRKGPQIASWRAGSRGLHTLRRTAEDTVERRGRLRAKYRCGSQKIPGEGVVEQRRARSPSSTTGSQRGYAVWCEVGPPREKSPERRLPWRPSRKICGRMGQKNLDLVNAKLATSGGPMLRREATVHHQSRCRSSRLGWSFAELQVSADEAALESHDARHRVDGCWQRPW